MNALSFNDIQVEVSDVGIASIFLNRPSRRNAFTPRMAYELEQAFHAGDEDPLVKVIVLGARGEQAFCAGADLQGGEMPPQSPAELQADRARGYSMDHAGRVTLAMLRCRKVIIVAITGHAVGVGITMTLAADIRIAWAGAKVGFVFARRGLVCEGASSYLLPRIVGRGRALEFCTTGRVFLAGDERNSGLFAHVLDDRAQVLARAQQIAADMVSHMAPVALCMTKELMSMQHKSARAANHAESQALAHCFSSEETAEGFASFLGKRAPQWSTNANDDSPVGWFIRSNL